MHIKLHLFCFICSLAQLVELVQGLGYYEATITTQKTRCLNPPRTARKVETFIKECQEEVKNKLVHEAFSILKHEASKIITPLNPNDDTVELIETLEQPTLNENDYQNHQHHHYHYSYQQQTQQQQPQHQQEQQESWQPETSTNDEDDQNSASNYNNNLNHQVLHPDSDYEYFEEDRHRRMISLMHRISRIDDLSSNGIYHPTLVPFEDKRIAGCLLHCVYAKNKAIDKMGWPTLDGLVDFYSGGVNEHGFFMATLRSVNLCLRAVANKYKVNRKKLPERGESCDVAFDVFDCISDQITGYCMDQYKS